MASDQPSLPPGDPVCPGCQTEGSLLLPCGHSLCQSCLQMCQLELGHDQQRCTECYGRELLDNVLKGLFDSIFQGQPRRDRTQAELGLGLFGEDNARAEDDKLCPKHGDSLTLFCMDDEVLICNQCQGEDHEGHECNGTEEAAQECKRQTHHTIHLIKADFEKLQNYLRDEEASLLTALKEEEEQKSRRMKEKIDRLTEEIKTLNETINSTEEAIASEHIEFLKNYKNASECYRVECTQQDIKEMSGALIDVAKHLSCLKFRVWEKMQTVVTFTPVTLDPNTADACLSLSDDLTVLRYTDEEQQVPDNPERFCYYECVLGSEALGTGRHSWDVEVGDSSEWSLGVVYDSVQRKEWFPPSPDHGMWIMGLHAGHYRASTSQPIPVKKKPQRVRVQLDWDVGRVTFSDAADNTLIYRFKARFTDKLYPYFSNTCKRHPLRILAEKVSVYTE